MMCVGAFASIIRRATSKPVSPGIWISRKTMSGCSRSIVVRASTPLPAWPMTATPPICPSRNPSSARASCSSSTRTARRSMTLRRHAFGNRQLGNLQTDGGALAGHALQLELVVGAVNGSKALVDVAEADAAAERAIEPFLSHPEAVVYDFDNRVAVAQLARDRDASSADLRGEAVLDRVFDQRLEDEARDDDVECGRMNLSDHLQLWPEPDHFDVQVLVDRLELFAQGDEVIGAAQQPPQQARELGDQYAGGFRLRADERRDRRERVEQEMRVDLVGERFELGGEQELFLLLEAVLDAGVVPDLDRRGHSQHRGEHDDREPHRPRGAGRQIEQSVMVT